MARTPALDPILHGDCLDVMRTMPSGSVSVVITDPPYGLSDHAPEDVAECLAAWLRGEAYEPRAKGGFMGRSWDAWVPGPEVWREALRVLKPGGHVLAFAGSRTLDLMSLAIRLAGFEIRDTLQWLYGGKYPKTLDVSQAIDKLDAKQEQHERRLRFTAWVRSTGVTPKQINEATSTNMGGHYTTDAAQPAIMTRAHLEACRRLFGDVPAWVEAECDKRSVESANFAAREVVGVKKNMPSGWNMDGTTKFADRPLTVAATPEARAWEGWGTALKPSYEPIVLARKPLAGTVAENVLEHGTGAINTSATRIHAEAETRYPSNVLVDPEVAEMIEAQQPDAARFFYCAKASPAELPVLADGYAHPSVKPLALMRWLVRLATPPGGLILDPFAGSGTTIEAAMLEGHRVLGIEADARSVELCRVRIERARSSGS